ncbi:CAAX amino terminal protease self- immunity [compost metagenome]
MDVFGEKLGLIGTSAAFGMYHYSLGFGLPICFVFAVTGLLLGGVVIRSKGLLAAIAMHALMNVIFVFTGIIFG